MAPRKQKDAADDPIGAAITAAADATERFAQAKSELEHRLADIDHALVEVVQRVFDTTPPEYQRTFVVTEGGSEDELTLPEFIRCLLERPRGSSGSFIIQVIENLYADGDDEYDDNELVLDDSDDTNDLGDPSGAGEPDDAGDSDDASAADASASADHNDDDPLPWET